MSEFPAPSDDLPLGAVETNDGKLRFALHAPGKRSVHVIGDFNDWNRKADPLTARDDGSWTLEKHLDAGEHAYQFLIDGEVVISDPYARVVRFGAKDEPATSVVAVHREPFHWRHAEWNRPAFSDLIIYELAVADFSEQGNLRGVIDQLDHIEKLGVNAIELMPIFGFASRSGWGYDPTHFFAIHPAYGSQDDLRELVDQCHGRGIAVLLDLVLAHTGTAHPFTRLYDLGASPWYSESLTKQEQMFGLPTLDYGRPAARRFAADVLSFWTRECHVDGYRLDYLSLIGVCDRGGIDHMVDTVRAVCDEAYLIGEHLPEDPQMTNASRLSGTWHLRVARMLRAIMLDRKVDDHDPSDFASCIEALDPGKQGYDHPTRMVNYVESHDEDRVVWELMENGDDADKARRKLALASSIIMTMPGEPMLYAGQEWGEHTRLNKQGNPLQWRQLDTDAGRGLFAHHQRLCRLRRDHIALRQGDFRVEQVDADRRVFVLHRWHDAGDEVVVAANLSDQDAELTIQMPRDGAWREVQSDQRIDVGEDRRLTWKLEAWSVALLVRLDDAGQGRR